MKTVDTLSLVGNRLCLDFVNTVGWRDSSEPVDCLTDEAALLSWAERMGLNVPQATTENLLEKALHLRETLHRIFYAFTHEKLVASNDLELLRTFYLEALSQASLETSEGGLSWQVSDSRPHALLHVLTFDALDLLESELIDRVCYCQGKGCGWLFLDTSRSRNKRWCSAKGCGNRMRVRRFVEKQKGSA